MRGHCDKCGVSSFLSRGKDEPCACGGTVKAKHEQSNEVVRAEGATEGVKLEEELRKALKGDVEAQSKILTAMKAVLPQDKADNVIHCHVPLEASEHKNEFGAFPLVWQPIAA